MTMARQTFCPDMCQQFPSLPQNPLSIDQMLMAAYFWIHKYIDVYTLYTTYTYIYTKTQHHAKTYAISSAWLCRNSLFTTEFEQKSKNIQPLCTPLSVLTALWQQCRRLLHCPWEMFTGLRRLFPVIVRLQGFTQSWKKHLKLTTWVRTNSFG